MLLIREITGLSTSRKVMHSVEPNEYRTKTGAKFKAPALQYALEPSASIPQDDNWIVHLDEETVLTHSVLVGILNFVQDSKYIFKIFLLIIFLRSIFN